MSNYISNDEVGRLFREHGELITHSNQLFPAYRMASARSLGSIFLSSEYLPNTEKSNFAIFLLWSTYATGSATPFFLKYSILDLVVRDGKVITNPYKRSKNDRTVRGFKTLYKTEPVEGPKLLDLIIKNTYRTLMTRGMRGCCICCTDSSTLWFKALQFLPGRV